METLNKKNHFSFFIVFSFLLLFSLLSNFDSSVFAGGGGGGGIAPTTSPGSLVGEFFNDANGDGKKGSTEKFIYSDGDGCPLYTKPKMIVRGASVYINDKIYPLDQCYGFSTPPTSTKPGPSYRAYPLYSYGNFIVTSIIPSGWRCSPGSSAVCPTQTVYVPSGGVGKASPVGIQTVQTYCTGPVANISWTDNPIIASDQPNPTKIRKIHIYELRYWIDNRRVDAGLQPFLWEDHPLVASDQPNPTKIRAKHINDLRKAIEEVYTKCTPTLPLPRWTDNPTVTPNVTKIKATHIMELRQRTEQAK